MIKKLAALILALTLCASCALAQAGANDLLCATALEMASEMQLLAGSDSWTSTYTNNVDVNAELEKMRQSKNVQRAVVCYCDKATLDTYGGMILNLAAPSIGMPAGMDSELVPYVIRRLPMVFATALNNRYGVNWIVATSTTTTTIARYIDGAAEGIALILLDFGADKPQILVSASIGSDSAALLSGTFVQLDSASVDLIFNIANGTFSVKNVLDTYMQTDDEQLANQVKVIMLEIADRLVIDVF